MRWLDLFSFIIGFIEGSSGVSVDISRQLYFLDCIAYTGFARADFINSESSTCSISISVVGRNIGLCGFFLFGLLRAFLIVGVNKI